MKYLKYIVLLSLFLTCERDDICPETTATTPQLVIEFYNAADNDILKSVSGFSVYAEDLFIDENNTLVLPENASSGTLIFNSSANTISLPLIIGDEPNEDDDNIITTRYLLETDTDLRLDDDATTNSNIDVLDISYTNGFVYVSRACGYKSVFNNLSIVNNTTNDTDTWITAINVLETETIENEDNVHVNILH